jgi:hypothetical protein
VCWRGGLAGLGDGDCVLCVMCVCVYVWRGVMRVGRCFGLWLMILNDEAGLSVLCVLCPCLTPLCQVDDVDFVPFERLLLVDLRVGIRGKRVR